VSNITRSSPHLFHPPQQTRSQDTLNRIAAAALELIAEGGVDSATVAAIVDRAGASVGSFYARFPAKEDLIRYLQDRVWTEAGERWDQALDLRAWEGLPMASVVEGIVGLLLRSFRADFQRRKVLGRGGEADSEGAFRMLSFHEHILTTVTPLFLDRSEEITHPEPVMGVRFGYLLVVGAIREFLELEEIQALTGETAEILPSSQALGPELARVWMRYLSPEARGGVVEGEVDFFDPWG